MSYFRIKIEELNNGEKHYIPQKSYLYTTGGWVKKTYLGWSNLGCEKFLDEHQAIEVINGYKSIEEKNKEEVRSSTYKMV